MGKLSHYDDSGQARMVDVSTKPDTRRTAVAHAFVRIKPGVLKHLPENPKGNPLEVARFAGISAAKKTSDLIPMCHPLMLSHVDVTCKIESEGVRITSSATITGPTGVEMEALTAASVAALTVYDMTKALDKGIEIQDIYLVEKTGGKSGDYRRNGKRLVERRSATASRTHAAGAARAAKARSAPSDVNESARGARKRR
jgi:cyclic pyranopterin phosphate synthase